MAKKKGFFGRLFGGGKQEEDTSRIAGLKEPEFAEPPQPEPEAAPVEETPVETAVDETEALLAEDYVEEAPAEVEPSPAAPEENVSPLFPEETPPEPEILEEVDAQTEDIAAKQARIAENLEQAQEELKALRESLDEDTLPAEPAPEPVAESEPVSEPDTDVISDLEPAIEPNIPPADESVVESVEEPVAEPEEPPAPENEEPKKRGLFGRLKEGLARTSSKLTEGVASIFTKRKLDDDTLEELEDLLITADLGVAAAGRVTEALAEGRFNKEISDEEVREVLAEEVAKTLAPFEKPLAPEAENRPHVILMAGVNGAGKTTTIGKLAKKFSDDGKSVMMAAGDTFRAAAIEQLQVWGERTGAPVIAKDVGADAAGLAYGALEAAKEQNIDVLLIDTAGRLQNRKELMEELAKVVRVIKKQDDTAPHDTVLVLDATVGQNALSQVETFREIAGVTGLVMTKLDGTARGGVLVALADKFALPVHYIGVGEGVEDLQSFEAETFAKALAGA